MFDPRVIDGQLAQAEANLARSTAQLAQSQANLARDTAQENYSRGVADRYEQLVKDGIFSQDQGRQTRANADALGQSLAADRAAIQSAQAQMAADQATINNIRLQKSYTTITAPIDGRTGNVTTKLGNLVNANQTELAQIYQVEPIYVTFAVPEGRLPEVKKYFDAGGKLPVVAQAQDGSGQPERGELSFIDNAVDTSTGTIKLKGTFKNTTHTLWPGQFVHVKVLLEQQENAVVIPASAIQNSQSGNYVYVVTPASTVEMRPVTVGTRADRADFIDRRLAELYPATPIPLDHNDAFTLLVAVLLSAQSTDKGVNKVTPHLFALADTPGIVSVVPCGSPSGSAVTDPGIPQTIQCIVSVMPSPVTASAS